MKAFVTMMAMVVAPAMVWAHCGTCGVGEAKAKEGKAHGAAVEKGACCAAAKQKACEACPAKKAKPCEACVALNKDATPDAAKVKCEACKAACAKREAKCPAKAECKKDAAPAPAKAP